MKRSRFQSGEVPRRRIWRDVGDLLIAGKRDVRAVGIGKHHGVAPFLVPEEVIDALLFHQPADEVEVGLAVLHAIDALGVGRRQFCFEVSDGIFLEDFLDDLRYRQILKNAAVGAAGKKPRPGADPRRIEMVATVHAGLGKTGDEAVEVARIAIWQFELDGDVLRQNVVQVNVRFLAEQGHIKFTQAPEFFPPVHAMEEQYVVPQGRDNFHYSALSHRHLPLRAVTSKPATGLPPSLRRAAQSINTVPKPAPANAERR